MIIYTDGSQLAGVKPWAKTGFACALLSTDSFETVVGTHNGCINGSHEYIAFAEACRAAWEKKVDAKDLTIFTDDELLGHAGFYLHDGNYKGSIAGQIKSRMGAVCNRHYDHWVYDLTLWYAAEARLHKVKSHKEWTPLYHHWVDYRARAAAQAKEHLEFDDWVAAGIFFPNGVNEDGTLQGKQWHAPFSIVASCDTMSYI